MHTFAIIFLVAVILTSLIITLLVHKMTGQLKRIHPTEENTFPMLRLPRILREHTKSFPGSYSMASCWLLLVYLLVWLVGIGFSLINDL
ncbi:MAG TPA: hypothetical protein VNZ03_37685 [Terriglobales bacterium]|jgi:hypothetical protein|nr:hypothetical protein [Terriglobales bacterium]